MLTFLSVKVFVFYYIGLINMVNPCPTHITVFIAMLRVENEKIQTPTIKSPASLNRN